MKIKITCDKWYHVHFLAEYFGIECDVPEATVARWRRVAEEFNQVQEEMEAVCEKARAKP